MCAIMKGEKGGKYACGTVRADTLVHTLWPVLCEKLHICPQVRMEMCSGGTPTPEHRYQAFEFRENCNVNDNQPAQSSTFLFMSYLYQSKYRITVLAKSYNTVLDYTVPIWRQLCTRFKEFPPDILKKETK
ncbi:hypothetical protein J6590_037258 [Homalodisca vitripennis]|nr:hypothetical protein J6590_037258 [Homalodisca vitripennis]